LGGGSWDGSRREVKEGETQGIAMNRSE